MDDLTRQSLVTALATVSAVLVALSAGLDEPYWAAISALVISNVDRTALFTKGVLRVGGTVLGIVTGYYVALSLEGLPFAQLLAILVVAAFGTYARRRSAYSYAWFYAAISFLLVMSCSLTMPDQLYLFARNRCYEIVIGVVVATVANWGFGPRSGTLPSGLAAAAISVTATDAAWQALAAGVGAVAIVLIWSLFDLPSLAQVFASSLVIIDSDPRTSRLRGTQRIIGCILGGLLGIAILGIDAADFVFWLLTLFGGVALCARLHLSTHPQAYVGTQMGVAFLLTVVAASPPENIEQPLNRLIGIIVGVSIMMAVSWALTAARPAVAAAEGVAEPQAGTS
jgi:uncharacterized membrane protein YccC